MKFFDINVLLCKRRAPTTDILDNTSDDPADVFKPVYSKLSARHYTLVDDASRSTDSSGPEHDTDSFDGSDTESDSEDLMPNSEPSTVDPDSEVDLSDAEAWSTSYREETQSGEIEQCAISTSLNPHAAPFVPGIEFQVAEELRSAPAEVIDGQTLGTLLQALSKLTPAEAAQMRAFLDNHLSSQEAANQSGGSQPPAPPSSPQARTLRARRVRHSSRHGLARG
jgi:hypothetical protein